MGLINKWILTWDWLEHGHSCGTGQHNQPVSSLCLTLIPVHDPSHRFTLMEHQANPFLCSQTPMQTLGCLPASEASASAHGSGTHLEPWLRYQNKPCLPRGVLIPAQGVYL